jgi:curved DNA-binding protein CbpA
VTTADKSRGTATDEVTMAQHNYYLILGESQSESPAGIRTRYRDLARILHPDVAGEQSTVDFQKVAEAYVVLADPQARRHDAELASWATACARAIC